METHYLTPEQYEAVMHTHAEAWVRIDGASLLRNAAAFVRRMSRRGRHECRTVRQGLR